MTLRQINSSAITSALVQDLETSRQVTGSGVPMLSPSQQSKALERLTDPTKSVLMVNQDLEIGVGSLIPLETRITKDYDICGYDIGSDATAENLDRCLRMVAASLVPLPFVELKQRLTALMIILAIPKDWSDDVVELKRDALAMELERWPADVVIEGIDYIKRTCKFMPTLADFCEYMSWRVQPRYLLMQELQKNIANRCKNG